MCQSTCLLCRWLGCIRDHVLHILGAADLFLMLSDWASRDVLSNHRVAVAMPPLEKKLAASKSKIKFLTKMNPANSRMSFLQTLQNKQKYSSRALPYVRQNNDLPYLNAPSTIARNFQSLHNRKWQSKCLPSCSMPSLKKT